ncbi:MAG TPA: response regulator transcription factor [Burkholderiales bacterium]|nr:response regulator transcription factor [Burkholderiales bacterium]
MNRAPTILVIEDDAAMRRGLEDNLEIDGYNVVCAATVRDGHAAAAEKDPDLILLDVMLPDGDGINLCKQLRAEGHTQPIIMVTAKGEEMNKVSALEIGADDYVVKPFSLRELLARIHAQLRRRNIREPLSGPVRVGAAKVDFERHRITRDGVDLETSAKEIELLRYLVDHRGEVISRDVLLTAVWGHESGVITRTVDNFIVRLRRKLEPDPANPQLLLTVHGRGYKLIKP